MKRERDPTPEEFEKLLAWLDSDPEEAGSKLNLIHSRVIRIFVSRGCIDAESLADEVSNRVAVRIDMVIKNYIDPLRCFLGFVDNVYREHLRDEKRPIVEPPRQRRSEQLERENQCLEECLKNLTKPERNLFERYFQGEKRVRINGRRKLAEELGITPNALRIQAHHKRRKVLECLQTCIENLIAETIWDQGS